VKVTFKLALPEAGTENELAGVQVIEPGVPAQADTEVTFSVEPPVFCTCVVSAFDVPTFTVPNASEVGLSAIAGIWGADTVKAGSATVWEPWPELFRSGVKKPTWRVDEFPDPNDAPATSYWLPYQATAQT
jgi:hypothetical protein